MVSADVTLLGIGGAFDADRGLANTGGLLEVRRGAETTRILLDCGHTAGLQLHALGLTCADVDAILVTHTHGDHIDGLETVGYKSLFLHQRRVAVHAPVDVLELVWKALAPKMSPLQIEAGVSVEAEFSTYFQPIAARGDVELPGGVTARFIPVPHVVDMPSYAIILQVDGLETAVRWSGDCTFQPESELFVGAKSADLIFHDCAFYPRYDATVHTHFEELETLPEAIRRRLVLVHHGQVEIDPAARAGMRLGQPLERFTLQ